MGIRERVAVAGAGYRVQKKKNQNKNKESLLIWAVLNFMMTVPNYSYPSTTHLRDLNGPGHTWQFPTDMNYGVMYLVLSYRILLGCHYAWGEHCRQKETSRRLPYTQAGSGLPKTFLGGIGLRGSQITEKRCQISSLAGFQMKAKISFVCLGWVTEGWVQPALAFLLLLSVARAGGYSQTPLGAEGKSHT